MLERIVSVHDISWCGEYFYGKKFKTAMNISKEREFVYVKEGSAVFTVDGRAFILKPGELLFNGKNKIITQSSTGEGAKVIMCAFSADAPSVFDSSVFRLKASQYIHTENISALARELSEGKKSEKAKLLIALQIEILMTVLADSEGVSASAEYNAPLFSEFGKIFSTVEENISEKLTLPVISDKTGLSEVNIKRICRECGGCGVSELVSKLKLIRAKELLSSGMKAKEAADALGFKNKNYFSSFFRREEGISLREYKGMKTNEGNI